MFGLSFKAPWTYLAFGIGFTAILTGSSILFAGDLAIAAFSLGVGTVLGSAWLIGRGLWGRARLPRTGVEMPLLVFLGGYLLSLSFSPAPRLGFDQAGWFILYGLLFFILLDLFKQPQLRSAACTALLAVSGFVLLVALLETYAWYLSWWAQTGSYSSIPPFQYRFISLAGHSSFFMALVNLCAPLALVTFFKTPRRTTRAASAFWLVMYLFSIPFSTSRGGWLGASGWAGTLGLFWLVSDGRWKRILTSLRRRWLAVSAVGLVLLLLVGGAATRFYQIFAGTNPTHATGLSLNRTHIWSWALTAWQSSPWLGVGPGRLGLELLRITKDYPAKWWPPHAHSTLLQILVETGVVGFLPFFVLLSTTAILLWRAYRATPAVFRPWSQAALAALVGAGIHSLFDEFNTLPILIVVIVFQVTLVLSAGKPLRRFQNLPLAGLAFPGLLLAALAGYNMWSYAPIHQAQPQAQAENWLAVASAAEESIRRDPLLPFYQSQAGLAWANAWKQSGDPEALTQARQHLAQGLALEPNNSLLWADLSVLDFQAGQTDLALQHMQRAMQLCPSEPSYPLDAGWMLEKLGMNEEARDQYLLAITLNPSSANHPFWQDTPLRQSVAGSAAGTQPNTSAYWKQAIEAANAGEQLRAQLDLALSSLYGESSVAVASTWAAITTQKNEQDARLTRVLQTVNSAYWDISGANNTYSLYFRRRSLVPIVAPGFLRLNEDSGQFAALKELSHRQAAAGDCQGAAATWEILQRELRAGELLKGSYPPSPACSD